MDLCRPESGRLCSSLSQRLAIAPSIYANLRVSNAVPQISSELERSSARNSITGHAQERIASRMPPAMGRARPAAAQCLGSMESLFVGLPAEPIGPGGGRWGVCIRYQSQWGQAA